MNSACGRPTAAETVAITYEEMGLITTEKNETGSTRARFWSGDTLPLESGYTLGDEIEVLPDRSNVESELDHVPVGHGVVRTFHPDLAGRFAAAIEPASTRSLNDTTSALMNPFRKMTPAAFGAVSPWRITHARASFGPAVDTSEAFSVESRAQASRPVLADGSSSSATPHRVPRGSADSDLREEHGIAGATTERLHPVGIGQDRLVAVEGVQKWRWSTGPVPGSLTNRLTRTVSCPRRGSAGGQATS